MAGFAITTEDIDSISIDQCHVNIWAMPGVLGRVFYYDLGVVIRPSKELSKLKLKIYLPFFATSAEDLRKLLLNSNLADLIFGESVTVGSGSIQFNDNRVLQILQAPLNSKSIVTHGKHQSICEIEFEQNFDTSKAYYLRIRFTTHNLGQLWQNKKSGMSLSNGAIVDLRFNDPREWGHFKGEAIVHPSTWLPIKRLQAFVIVPAYLQVRAKSPQFKYMRSLERACWRDYLDRALSFGSPTFLIYYWDTKQTSAKDITSEHPARFFMDLSRDVPYLSAPNFVRFSLIVILAIIFVPILQREFSNLISTEPAQKLVSMASSKIAPYLSVAAIAGLVLKGLKMIPKAGPLVETMCKYRDGFEKWLFGLHKK